MAYAKEKRVDDSIWKLKDGRYLVELRLGNGYSNVHRKTRDTLREAKYYRDTVRAKKAADSEFMPNAPKDRRDLVSIIEVWWGLFGQNLKDGKRRRSKLLFLADIWGNPSLDKITAVSYLEFRQLRMASGVGRNTVDHDLAYLKSMFNRLVKVNELHENPLREVELLGSDEAEIRYLELSEIRSLLDALLESSSRDGYTVCRICLETGCRISEATGLTAAQVRGGVIQFARTKNSNSRAVPISPELEREIRGGRPRSGRLFVDSINRAFSTALVKARIELPRGQKTHVMRHSFAVHFMRDKGSILDLQKILGHKTLKMTLRYAQFHPDYLADAVIKNPIAIMGRSRSAAA